MLHYMKFLLRQIKLNLPPKLTLKIFFWILTLIGKAFLYYLGVWHWIQASECFSKNYERNVLYLNKILFRFKKVDFPLCSYCNEEEETPLHLFHSWLKTKQLWNKLRQYFSQFINIPHSTPQSSILGIFDNNQHSELINHLLLIFKFYIYIARNTKQLNFDNLKITIKEIKEIEKELTSSNKRKLLKKWHPIDVNPYDWLTLCSKWKGREAGSV